MIRCAECEYGKSHVFPRHGCGNSRQCGTFYQEGHTCEHPDRTYKKSAYIFYGKTSPQECPLKQKKGAKHEYQGKSFH